MCLALWELCQRSLGHRLRIQGLSQRALKARFRSVVGQLASKTESSFQRWWLGIYESWGGALARCESDAFGAARAIKRSESVQVLLILSARQLEPEPVPNVQNEKRSNDGYN